MILAFDLADIIQVPFGYLLDVLYQFTASYGWALILFSIIVKLLLLPTTIKSKKSTMKMSRLTPQVQLIQKKYADDQQKQSAALQELYKKEGVSMGGGCLWSLLPLLILIPLYTIIREPITYILHETGTLADGTTVATALTNAVKEANPSLFTGNSLYHELIAAANLTPEIAAGVEGVKNVARTGQGLDFIFLGIDLSQQPQFNVFDSTVWAWNWAHIGALLLPVLSAGSQVLTVFISQKVNNSLVTNSKGIQDKDTAKESQTAKTSKAMMFMMPIMTLIIGFSMPAAMSLYWLIQGIVSTVLDTILTKTLRKDYDEEDAIRLAQAIAEEEAKLEKERIRAQRRAANPDGITENTSKKKLQQKQQKEQEAAKAAARKEYNAKRGIVEEEPDEKAPMSGIAERPYCKGRAYDPNRYASETTEE